MLRALRSRLRALRSRLRLLAPDLRTERDDDHLGAARRRGGPRDSPTGCGCCGCRFGHCAPGFGCSARRFGCCGFGFGYSNRSRPGPRSGREPEGQDRARHRGRHRRLRDGRHRLLPVLREPEPGRAHRLRLHRPGREVLRGRGGRRDRHLPDAGPVHGLHPDFVAAAAPHRARHDVRERLLQRRGLRRDQRPPGQGAGPRPDASAVRHRCGGRPPHPGPPGGAARRPRHHPRPPLAARPPPDLAHLQDDEVVAGQLQLRDGPAPRAGHLQRLERVQGGVEEAGAGRGQRAGPGPAAEEAGALRPDRR